VSLNLEADKVVKTLEVLRARIEERFPGSGLGTLCADLIVTARATTRRARAAGRPNLLLRFLVLTVLGAAVAGQVFAVIHLHPERWFSGGDTLGLTQGLESFVNLAILAGAAIWFLFTLEERLKRRTVLEHLHELRSVAHVVDMHQLTKDPVIVLKKVPRTASSPKREMSEFELARYLDYCSEMLALTGKLAALYLEHTRDSEVVAAANEIESLCTNLGRKIWQKIMIVSRGELGAGT
jgi:hypothetical protein